jgi:sortase A
VQRATHVLPRLDQPSGPVQDAPTLAGSPATTAPTTTTVPQVATAAPQGLPDQPSSPIVIPANPYAPETPVEIGTIQIPKIGLSHRIFHGVTLRTIDKGPSHWPGTPWPGQSGNSVFAGHRVTNSQPFRHLDKLAPGDEVIFTVGGVRSVYAVTGSEVVTPQATYIADPTPTPTATLYACHPPGSARYRYVVHLALVSAQPAAA